MYRRSLLGALLTSVLAISATIFVSAPPPASAHPLVPADSTATATTANVLTWLGHLPNRAGNRVASGHFGGFTDTGRFTLADIERLHDQTGQYPTILGCDYASGWDYNGTTDWTDDYPTTIGYSCNADLINWSRAGGLVTISVHAPNPGTLGAKTLPTFGDLDDPGTATGAQWRRYLDLMADGLQQLADAGVPVLFRPFHEMNGAWFWWGAKSSADFTAAWRDMFGYLTGTRGLHNLLWVYAPDCGPAGNKAAYYPGADVIDVVGLDCYRTDPTHVDGYDDLIALGKPFAFTEMGTSDPDTRFDYRKWIEAIRTRFPATTFFQAWEGKWSPANHDYASEFMNHPWVVNRGEVALDRRTEPPATAAPVGPSTMLASFESGPAGWTGYNVTSGLTTTTGWKSAGLYSLKADIDLGRGDSYLRVLAQRDLSHSVTVTATARTAATGNPAAGTTARLYVKTGANYVDYNGPTIPIGSGSEGSQISVRLNGIPNLTDVREVGVRFIPAPGASGTTSVYLDDVRLVDPPQVQSDFETGAQGWGGWHVLAGPWPVTEWAASPGGQSLKADVDLSAGECFLNRVGTLNLTGRVAISATVRTAPWGDHGSGTTAKLYVRTGANAVWHDMPAIPVDANGTTLVLDLRAVPDLDDVREIGVQWQPAAGATGRSAVYVDDVLLGSAPFLPVIPL